MNEAASPHGHAPARTATFLFTDIEGSTRLWEDHRDAMSGALETHDSLLRSIVERSGGDVVKTTGDGMLAAFDRAESALAAALDGQIDLAEHDWPGTGPLRVRMAIHSGTADVRDGDFFGPALNRVARLLAIGHGGQVLVSGTTAGLVADDLPAGSELIDLGEHRLRDLDRPERVYQLVGPPLRREFPPLRSGSSHPTNLPLQVTSFVGREQELVDIERLLSTGRMVTLVGVGGTGKTRLALHAAADVVERYANGAWLVELAPLTDAGLVVAEIGRALRVQPQPDQPPLEPLVDYLRSKELLLVLDNCEHLIETVADVAYRLLGSCSDLRILTSSREPLGIDGERVYAVPSLTLPADPDVDRAHAPADAEELEQAERSEAVSLFVERARSILPSFALDASNVGAVVEICRRLDGIPLALELAAARVNLLSPAEIAEGLGDRFRLLTGGRRTALPRQRTLQALVDWSWDLLDDADRRLLRRLSVFAGGWTLEAAESVTADLTDGGARPGGAARVATLDGLGRLVDRSLVTVDHAGATRYRMLETIRQYAADRLAESGEARDLRDRHLSTYLQLTVAAEAGLAGPGMTTWLLRLDTEIDNLRAALDWAFEAHPEAGLEMCVALIRYWRSRSMGSEGLDRTGQAIDHVRALAPPDAEATARARAVLLARGLAGAAFLKLTGGRPDAAAVAEEAIGAARAAGDPAALIDAVTTLVNVRALVTDGRDVDAWRTMLLEALTLGETLGDGTRVARLQAILALIEAPLDPPSADAWLERASEAAAKSGNPLEIATISHIRGRIASRTGRLVDAQRWFAQSQAQFHAIGDRRFELSARSELAHALRRSGAIDAAEAEYRETIHGWQHSGNRGAIANQLEAIAFLAVARGSGERAARLLGAAEALREVAGSPMTAQERQEYDGELLRLRAQLEAAALDEHWAEGRAMSSEEAVALARAG